MPLNDLRFLSTTCSLSAGGYFKVLTDPSIDKLQSRPPAIFALCSHRTSRRSQQKRFERCVTGDEIDNLRLAGCNRRSSDSLAHFLLLLRRESHIFLSFVGQEVSRESLQLRSCWGRHVARRLECAVELTDDRNGGRRVWIIPLRGIGRRGTHVGRCTERTGLWKEETDRVLHRG